MKVPCAFALLTVLFLAFTGCVKETDGYRVVSYDAGTQQWTILHSTHAGSKPLNETLVVSCVLSAYGAPESDLTLNTCNLEVGRVYAPGVSRQRRGAEGDAYVRVDETADTLVVDQWEDGTSHNQVFRVVKPGAVPGM